MTHHQGKTREVRMTLSLYRGLRYGLPLSMSLWLVFAYVAARVWG